MNATPALVEKTLSSMPAYVEHFKKAFPEDASPVTFDNVAKALEAFEADADYAGLALRSVSGGRSQRPERA